RCDRDGERSGQAFCRRDTAQQKLMGAPLRGGGLTEEWWAGLGHALEQCDRQRAGEEVDPPEGVNRETDEPTWTDVAIACARLSRKIDRENKGLAEFYLREYASILGPEISIDILRDHF